MPQLHSQSSSLLMENWTVSTTEAQNEVYMRYDRTEHSVSKLDI